MLIRTLYSAIIAITYVLLSPRRWPGTHLRPLKHFRTEQAGDMNEKDGASGKDDEEAILIFLQTSQD